MRRILLLLFAIAGLACPSRAAMQTQSVTVAQLGQYLAGAHSRSDGRIAKDLANMILAERVPTAQLAQWQAALPGRRSREGLTILADRSAFLDSPAADRLPDQPPDLKAQGAIISRAVGYINQTLTRLPDFFATRTTEYFEGLSADREYESMSLAGYPKDAYVPLASAGHTSVPVTYSDGAETQGAQRMDWSLLTHGSPEMTTAGEFGPILSTVLADAMHGVIAWGYWEQDAGGKLAVFRYSVPQDQSNYSVALQDVKRGAKLIPAYHGELAIEPVTGTILRITIVADTAPTSAVQQSAIAVNYGQVLLGGKTYTCPLQSVALLKAIVDAPQGAVTMKASLNNVTFDGYHLARGDVTILPAAQ